MKTSDLFEARALAATKKPSLNQMGANFADKPKSHQKGDIAWHLNRFWQRQGTDWRTKRNPEYNKAMKIIVAEFRDELIKRNPMWKGVTVSEIIKFINDIKKKQHEDARYYGHRPSKTFSLSYYGGLLRSIPEFKELHGKYTTASMKKEQALKERLEKEFNTTWKATLGRRDLPVQSIPQSVESLYVPKQGLIATWVEEDEVHCEWCWEVEDVEANHHWEDCPEMPEKEKEDWREEVETMNQYSSGVGFSASDHPHNLMALKVVSDASGNITRVFGLPNIDGSNRPWNLSEIIDWDPQDIRDTIHYYKKHKYR